MAVCKSLWTHRTHETATSSFSVPGLPECVLLTCEEVPGTVRIADDGDNPVVQFLDEISTSDVCSWVFWSTASWSWNLTMWYGAWCGSCGGGGRWSCIVQEMEMVPQFFRPASGGIPGGKEWLGYADLVGGGSYSTTEAAARAYDAALLCLKGSSTDFNFPDSLSHHQKPTLVTSTKFIQRAADAAANNAASPVVEEHKVPGQHEVPGRPGCRPCPGEEG